jgi:hypothetical protein
MSTSLDSVIEAVEQANMWWSLWHGYYTEDPPGYKARVSVVMDSRDAPSAEAEGATPAEALMRAAEALLKRPLGV